MGKSGSISGRVCAILALCAMLAMSPAAWAQSVPPLGSAADFSVLAGSAVSNTGATVVTGDLGIWPGTASSVTGFPPGSISGTLHAGDAVAQQAQSDLTVAYNSAAGQACGTVLTGTDLGGLTLIPGVYCFASSAQLTGTLTLDAQGNPDAVFIFQIGSTLTTASGSQVQVINGGSGCRVFWQVGSSATLGTATALEGNILALTSITLTTGASVSGRVLARNGAVTLDTNAVGGCITGACPVIELLPTTLPQGVQGVAYSAMVAASGGQAPYTYSVSAGALPTGLSLDAGSGGITGTPTALGNASFTITAVDANGCERSRAYTLVISAAMCPPITLAPPSLPGATVGSPYSQFIAAAGGSAPYTYSITAGALPPGLQLGSASGELSGTLTTIGSFDFTVTATDANFCVASQGYGLVVGGALCPDISLAPTTLPQMLLGAPFSQLLVASGGTPPYTYAVSAGALPPGLQLDTQTGLLSGTPSSLGDYNFRITAIDSLGCRVDRAYASRVALTPPAFIPASSGWVLPFVFICVALLGMAALRR